MIEVKLNGSKAGGGRRGEMNIHWHGKEFKLIPLGEPKGNEVIYSLLAPAGIDSEEVDWPSDYYIEQMVRGKIVHEDAGDDPLRAEAIIRLRPYGTGAIWVSKVDEYVTEESEGDVDRYEDGGEQEFEPDEYDLEDELTAVDLVVDYLAREGVCYASSSDWTPCLWYETASEMDPATGEWQQSHYHVQATKQEQEQIYQTMKSRGILL